MSENSTSPAYSFLAVTPSDSVNSPTEFRALYVGTTGDLTVLNASGDLITFVGVPGGSILPVYTFRVNSTGTTAADIVALF